MLRAGDLFSAGKQGGVVGAFLKGRRGCIGVTAYHIMRLARTKDLTVGEMKGEVVADWKAFDLVYFKTYGCEPTPLAAPKLGPARLASALGTRGCSISEVGDLISIVIGHAEMPGPGESGTPLYQDGKVVGILSSINLNTGKGTIISARVIEKGGGGADRTRGSELLSHPAAHPAAHSANPTPARAPAATTERPARPGRRGDITAWISSPRDGRN